MRGGLFTLRPMRATNEREPPRQMGSMDSSKGPYFAPISGIITLADFSGTQVEVFTFEYRAWAISSHVTGVTACC